MRAVHPTVRDADEYAVKANCTKIELERQLRAETLIDLGQR
jgi:hypothetical protein